MLSARCAQFVSPMLFYYWRPCASWKCLGACLRCLGVPWRRLWNVLERLWRCLEASWRRLWRSWSVLRTSWKCAEAVSSTGVVFSACAEVRRDLRRGSFLDRAHVFSVRRGAQRRAQRQFPRQGSCFQRAQRCAAACAEAVSSTEVVFSARAEVCRDVRRGSFLDRGRVFSVRS